MRIAILGAGNVGAALGRGLARAGHAVTFGVRDPASPKTVAALSDDTGALAATTIREAVAQSEIVILATPWAAVPDVLAAAGDFGGRVLVDATNPIGPGFKLVFGHTASGAEHVQSLAPTARVAKAFNTTGAENMANPAFPEGPIAMFIAADAPDARAAVAGLARDIGFDPVEAGPLSNARLLEPLALLWIDLALRQGMGRAFALRIARR